MHSRFYTIFQKLLKFQARGGGSTSSQDHLLPFFSHSFCISSYYHNLHLSETSHFIQQYFLYCVVRARSFLYGISYRCLRRSEVNLASPEEQSLCGVLAAATTPRAPPATPSGVSLQHEDKENSSQIHFYKPCEVAKIPRTG